MAFLKGSSTVSASSRTLAVIPARGGSKGIPQKNLVLLDGKPLLAYTCAQARNAKTVTRVILSTDDDAIAACAKRFRVEMPFRRPQELAADDTPMLAVLRHALETLRRQERYQPDIVVLLQPTSPLRRADDIDGAVQLLSARRADSVVSVVEVPHQFNPVSLLRMQEDHLVPFFNGQSVARRQDKPAVYARNGPAVLAVSGQVLETQNSLYGNVCLPFIMPPERSVDIDSAFDLGLAEYLLRGEHVG